MYLAFIREKITSFYGLTDKILSNSHEIQPVHMIDYYMTRNSCLFFQGGFSNGDFGGRIYQN